MNLLRTLFPSHLVNQISTIYISDAGYEDELIWDPSPLGEFSVKFVYQTMFTFYNDQEWPKEDLLVLDTYWHIIWELPVPHKMQFLIW